MSEIYTGGALEVTAQSSLGAFLTIYALYVKGGDYYQLADSSQAAEVCNLGEIDDPEFIFGQPDEEQGSVVLPEEALIASHGCHGTYECYCVLYNYLLQCIERRCDCVENMPDVESTIVPDQAFLNNQNKLRELKLGAEHFSPE